MFSLMCNVCRCCLSFCSSFFGHCVGCPSIYGFWLPLWFCYLQTLLRMFRWLVNEQILLIYLFFISLHYIYILLMFFINESMSFSPIPNHLTVYCRLQITGKYWWFNIRLILTRNYYRPIIEDVMPYRITYKSAIMLNQCNWWSW
jgi:hypothetical protein